MLATITRNGICLDLPYSPYTYTLNDIQYQFSSVRYREKFINEYIKTREYLESWVGNRLDVMFDLNIIADLMTYRQIEKRGFYIYINGRGYQKWQLQLNGVLETERS